MTEPPRPTDPLVWPDDQSGELTIDHYAAIGRVAAEWAALETTIDSACLRLAQIEPRIGVCLTSQIAGWGRKLDAYIALARLSGATETVRKLNAFAEDTNGLADQRNRVVHDPWVGSTKPHRLQATAKKKLRLEFIDTPTEDVVKISQRITDHNARFDQLEAEVTAEVATLRDKPPPTSP
jgi:hypothetical protein